MGVPSEYKIGKCNVILRARRLVVDSLKVAYNQINFDRLNGYPSGGWSDWPDKPCIFLLSYMRSGSTLLSNLITSSDEICGFGETAIRYSVDNSYELLLDKLSASSAGASLQGASFLFDKILHNHLGFPFYHPRFQNSRYLILLRHPAYALSSMMKMPRYGNVSSASVRLNINQDYLFSRLCALEFAMATYSFDFMVLSYESLVSDSSLVLERVSSFVGLSEVLSQDYVVDVNKMTWGVGDASDKIKEGRILPARTLEGQDLPPVPDRIMRVYDRLMGRI